MRPIIVPLSRCVFCTYNDIRRRGPAFITKRRVHSTEAIKPAPSLVKRSASPRNAGLRELATPVVQSKRSRSHTVSRTIFVLLSSATMIRLTTANSGAEKIIRSGSGIGQNQVWRCNPADDPVLGASCARSNSEAGETAFHRTTSRPYVSCANGPGRRCAR